MSFESPKKDRYAASIPRLSDGRRRYLISAPIVNSPLLPVLFGTSKFVKP